MKKFKHIKTGLIVELDLNGDYKFSNNENSKYIIPTFIIECIPEWQEIIEKDYEILSIKSETGVVYKRDSQLKDTYCYNDGKSPFFGLNTLKNSFIHSIKRLSDGEIFTIGDKIDVTYSVNCTIQKFNIEGQHLFTYVQNDCAYLISNIKHAKRPLFITEDGVEVFESDEYFSMYLKDYIYIKHKAESNHIKADGIYMLDFSTKQAAEEYILMNKSCLSINDLIKVVSITYYNLTKLKELVKSKLNK